MSKFLSNSEVETPECSASEPIFLANDKIMILYDGHEPEPEKVYVVIASKIIMDDGEFSITDIQLNETDIQRLKDVLGNLYTEPKLMFTTHYLRW